MEEIIDIDELAEKEENEKLKEYLKEDETVSKELSDKIEELTNEKNDIVTNLRVNYGLDFMSLNAYMNK